MGLFAFLALQLVLAVGVAQGRWKLHDTIFVNKKQLLDDHLASTPEATRLLVMGSSRVLFGVDAKQINESMRDDGIDAFNFGIAAAGPLTQMVYLERLLDGGWKPNIVAIEVLPAMFAQSATPFESKWLKSSRLTADERVVVSACGMVVDQGETRVHRWLAPSLVHRVGILRRVWPEMLGSEDRIDGHNVSDSHGFARSSIVSVTPEQYVKGVAGAGRTYQPYLEKVSIGNPGRAAFERMLTRCRLEGIRVVVFVMPEAPEFQAFYGAGFRSELDQYLSRARSEFDYDWIDARDWLPADAFHDGHHLIASGAARMSERFAKELRSILRAGDRP